MATYAKIWTDIFNDDFFSSLSLAERGMWMQLFTYAKLCGDTARINLRSFRTIGSILGCDGKTAKRILRKFSANSAVELVENKGNITITLCNYEKHQHFRRPEDRQDYKIIAENSPLIREDKINKVGAKNPDHQKAIEYWMQKYEAEIGVPYNFVGRKEGPIIKRLLKAYGLDVLKQIMDQIFITQDEFIRKKGGRTLGVLSACVNKLAQEVFVKDSPLDQLSEAGRATALNAQAYLRDLEEKQNAK